MDEPSRKRPGIEIPDDLARTVGVPGDLDADVLGPYTVPSLTRRRRAGLYYFGGAVLTAWAASTSLPNGLFAAAGGMLAIGLYHFFTAWDIEVSDADALTTANVEIGFPVGHASAAMSFEGWRAKPMWNVLVFSSDDPPSERGLVRIDAMDGTIHETLREPNSE